MTAGATKPVELSVVIPARNEAARIGATLAALAAWAALAGRRIEVVIADDGSQDHTAEMALDAAAPLAVRVLRLPARGPGHAVRAGIAVARGARILVCDADGAVPFCEIDRLWRALDDRCDIAVGSRALLPPARSWHRRLMGRGWGRLVRLIARPPVRDTQCGFKLFGRAAAARLFAEVRSCGFAFHVETLLVARRLGMRIAELPVRWREVPGSKVRLVRDSLNMVRELGLACLRERRLKLAMERPPRLNGHDAPRVSTPL